MGMKNVRLNELKTELNAKPISSVDNVKQYDPTEVNDSALKDDHRLVHSWWTRAQLDKDIQYSNSLLRTVHYKIKKELESRGIEHDSDLDDGMSYLSDDELELLFDNIDTETNLYKLIRQSMVNRGLYKDTEYEAKQTLEENEVQPHKFLNVLKPQMGYKVGEFYGEDAIENALRVSDYPVYVEPKLKGHRCIVSSKEDEVRVFSQNGDEYTQHVPSLTEEVEKLDGDIVIDGVIRAFDDGELKPADEVVESLKKEKLNKEEMSVEFVAFDCIYYNEDIHEKELSERRKTLTDLIDDKSKTLSIIDSSEIESREQLIPEIEQYKQLNDSEGAVIKAIDSPYKLSGETESWWKFKQKPSFRAKVIGKNDIVGDSTNEYFYDIGVPLEEEWSDLVEEDIREFNDDDYIFLGNTIPTNREIELGEVVEVAFENLFVYPDKERVRTYLPNIKELSDGDLTGVDELLTMADESGVLIRKQQLNNPFIQYPSDKETEFVLQHHAIGKGVHGDLRIRVDDYLVGWTLNIQPQGSVDEEITTVDQLKEVTNDVDWKYDQDRINVQKKDPAPVDWLDAEGVIEPGEVGAGEDLPGVFYIWDKGVVEFGAQFDGYHEYFIYPEKNSDLKPGIITFNRYTSNDNHVWNMRHPDEQVPYMLTDKPQDRKWMPPKGESALPGDIEEQIPDEFAYWKDNDEGSRLRTHRKMLEAIDDGELLIDGFTVQNSEEFHTDQTMKGDGVYRLSEHEGANILSIETPQRNFVFKCEDDPTEQISVLAKDISDECDDEFIETLSEPDGSVIAFDTDDGDIQIELEDVGVVQLNKTGDDWEIKRCRSSALEMDLSYLDGNKVAGTGMTHGVWKGWYWPKETIFDALEKFKSNPVDVEHDNRKVGHTTLVEKRGDEIYIEAEIDDEATLEKIKNGEYKGFSPEAHIRGDKDRHVVEDIMDVKFYSLTATPACSLCTFDDG